MDTKPAQRTASLTAALLLGVTLLGLAPAPATALASVVPQVPPTSDTWIQSNTGNGTDYTVGYEPMIRNADGTLVASGTEAAPGDTHKLVDGQFGWVEGNAVQRQVVTGPSTDLKLGLVQVVPGLGWFLAVDRAIGQSDPDLRDGSGAGFVPQAGELFDVALDWEAREGCPADTALDAWHGGSGASGTLRALPEVAFQTTSHNINKAFEDSLHRYDRLLVTIKGPVAASVAQCKLDIHYHFLLRFVFETSYPNPFQPDPTIVFASETQEFRLYVDSAIASRPTYSVTYVPIVFVNWVCNAATSTSDCTAQQLANAQSGGSRAVAFPAVGGGGYFGLTMKPSAAGWQGALTFIPSPYTSYQVSRTKLVTLDNLGQYREVDWPGTYYTY